MGRLVDLLWSGAEIAWAEGRRAARADRHLVRTVALGGVFALLVLTGIGFLVAAACTALAPAVGSAAALLLTGAGAALLGLLGLGLCRRAWR